MPNFIRNFILFSIFLTDNTRTWLPRVDSCTVHGITHHLNQ
jgi:hypothetical protein